MSISASDVKELRELTGAGMMDCKKALSENNGDKEAAIDYLRAKGLAKAAKKQGRIAADGLIGTFLTTNGQTGTLVEVNCETDFVAKNDAFKEFVFNLSKLVAENGITTGDDLLKTTYGPEGTVEDEINNLTLKIGEKIAFRRLHTTNVAGTGAVGSYVHTGKIGVLVEVETDKDLTSNDSFNNAVKDICMHVAASDTQFIRADEMDEEFKNREAEVYAAQLREQGKPEDMIPNIVKGKLNKLASEVCLLNQKFVKDPDLTVEKFLSGVASEVGGTITVKKFTKFTLGEGIEKKEDNLAEEVAKMTGGN